MGKQRVASLFQDFCYLCPMSLKSFFLQSHDKECHHIKLSFHFNLTSGQRQSTDPRNHLDTLPQARRQPDVKLTAGYRGRGTTSQQFKNYMWERWQTHGQAYSHRMPEVSLETWSKFLRHHRHRQETVLTYKNQDYEDVQTKVKWDELIRFQIEYSIVCLNVGTKSIFRKDSASPIVLHLSSDSVFHSHIKSLALLTMKRPWGAHQTENLITWFAAESRVLHLHLSKMHVPCPRQRLRARRGGNRRKTDSGWSSAVVSPDTERATSTLSALYSHPSTRGQFHDILGYTESAVLAVL